MTDNNNFQNEIKCLKWSIDTLFAIQKQIIQANEPLLSSSILRRFFGIGKGARAKKSRLKIYLAINGERTVNEIADLTGILLPNVSREITPLKEGGLIEITREEPKGIIYQKTFLDSLLNLTQKLAESDEGTMEQFLK